MRSRLGNRLFQQHHLPCLDEIARLEAVEVDASGVPCDLMICRGLFTVDNLFVWDFFDYNEFLGVRFT